MAGKIVGHCSFAGAFFSRGTFAKTEPVGTAMLLPPCHPLSLLRPSVAAHAAQHDLFLGFLLQNRISLGKLY